MLEDHRKVIHVAFGKQRGRIAPPKPATENAPPAVGKAPAGDRTQPAPAARTDDPLTNLYSASDVSRLFGFTPARLRQWARSGFLAPSGGEPQRRRYTFQDLVGLRTAKGLLEAGVPLQQVQRSVLTLRRLLPQLRRPLSEARIRADGQTVLVHDQQGTFEALTGQHVLDFRVDALRQDVVHTLQQPAASPPKKTGAYDHYLTGCRLEADASTWEAAETAYRRAISLDPSFANAMTNLGNLRLRRGDEADAEAWYRRALRVQMDQPEALYNLGCLHQRRHQPLRAVDCFLRALQQDAGFADAHFNLALAYSELGESRQAAPHWQAYLELDPHGPSADLARQRLGQPS